MKDASLEVELRSLEKLRRTLSRKLDKSYLRDNITEFLVLEKRYEMVVGAINKTRSSMKRRPGRKVNYV